MRYITILEACRVASVSRRTIYNWMDAGLLKYKLTPSGSRRILESDLFIERQQDAPIQQEQS